MSYFPTVYDTCFNFGYVKEDIIPRLNQSVPITSVVCFYVYSIQIRYFNYI